MAKTGIVYGSFLTTNTRFALINTKSLSLANNNNTDVSNYTLEGTQYLQI